MRSQARPDCRRHGARGDPVKGGGGWPWVLSDLKTLLETGKPLAA